MRFNAVLYVSATLVVVLMGLVATRPPSNAPPSSARWVYCQCPPDRPTCRPQVVFIDSGGCSPAWTVCPEGTILVAGLSDGGVDRADAAP